MEVIGQRERRSEVRSRCACRRLRPWLVILGAGLACCVGITLSLSQPATLGSFKRSSTQTSPPTRPQSRFWPR